MATRQFPGRSIQTPPGARRIFLIIAALLLLFGARAIASFFIEFAWWKELGQVATWTAMLLYGLLPVALAALLLFAAFWVAHARGLKLAGTGLRHHPTYARLSAGVLLLLAIMVAAANLDSWTVVRYAGSQRAGVSAGEWRDPVFHHALSFYFFDLPFWSELLGVLLAAACFSTLLYWLTARFWQLRDRLEQNDDRVLQFDLRDLRLPGGLESGFLRLLAMLFLIALSLRFFLNRYSLLLNDHGFLVGMDWVDQNINLPLVYLQVVACLAAAAFIWLGRWKTAIAVGVAVMAARAVIPAAVSAAYVRPNELSLQRSYIQRHIQSTRAAFGLRDKLSEAQFPARLDAAIDPVRAKPLLENVRLWDWRAFHDTVSQIQALRQYYSFADTDVDRYMIDGQLRQVMLTPRELDVRQLADARANWINGHFIYTHGYGLVMADANQITPSGSPVLLIQDAPPQVNAGNLKLTRPELYYGEITHEPVFVRTQQAEFDYPAGSENRHTRYEGTGGIPISSFLMRLAAAIEYADRNVLLTGILTGESRMLIHRNVRERLEKLAGFIDWDPDPYLVLSGSGRLVWTIDGYTNSSSHPFSRRVRVGEMGGVNYVRNSVKATIDAYDGSVTLYVFDEADPIIRAWRAIFPSLFRPASAMPADLRSHTRYPEMLFRTQAEIYRVFHMQDTDAFYNKEDIWDLGRNLYEGKQEPVAPTYVIAALPGNPKPEFLLVQPFTPRGKDNLIGLMMARCDGPNLGELVVLQLSKQSLIYGPMQIEARISQDQNISKDLNLWNQQGSSVLRGQMLTLPVDNTLVYIEPIYIQSSSARMPQLKKVVVATGNTLIYKDTYSEALAELGIGTGAAPAAPPPDPAKQVSSSTPPAGVTPETERRLNEIRDHLRRYKELASQGKWAEAGKELESVERLAAR